MLSIFTDAATSPQYGIAVGAYLLLDHQQLTEYAHDGLDALSIKIADSITYRPLQSKKSTYSEITTVITALIAAQNKWGQACSVNLLTDCQSVCDLLGARKEKLQRCDFMTRAGRIHAHASLYKELFILADQCHIRPIKMKGHEANHLQVTIQEKIFSLIDKLSRQHLRTLINQMN